MAVGAEPCDQVDQKMLSQRLEEISLVAKVLAEKRSGRFRDRPPIIDLARGVKQEARRSMILWVSRLTRRLP